MECNSKLDIFKPPCLGLRILQLILRPEVAQYEIGDLEEEYRARAKTYGIKRARRWFWIQVLSTLRITIKEDELWQFLLGKGIIWYWKRTGLISPLQAETEFIRQSLIMIIVIPSTLFLLITMYLLISQPNKSRMQAAQIPESFRQSGFSNRSESISVMVREEAKAFSIQKITIKSFQMMERRKVLANVDVNAGPVEVSPPASVEVLDDLSIGRPPSTIPISFNSEPAAVSQSKNMEAPGPCGVDSAIAENHKRKSQPENEDAKPVTGGRCML